MSSLLGSSIEIAASGLKFQAARMRVGAENMANESSTSSRPGGDPYRRKLVSASHRFDSNLDAQVVEIGRIRRDPTAFGIKIDPGNPGADAKGQVKLPNINAPVEALDLQQARLSYEANLNMISTTRQMLARTVDIIRG